MEIQVKVEDLKKHRVFVATPMYGGMAHGLYIKSSLDLQTTMSKYGIETQILISLQRIINHTGPQLSR
jgi:hypothetical protein